MVCKKTVPSKGSHLKVNINLTKGAKCLVFDTTKDRMPAFVILISHGFTFVIWAAICLTSEIWPFVGQFFCSLYIYSCMLCTHDGDDGQMTAGWVVTFWEGWQGRQQEEDRWANHLIDTTLNHIVLTLKHAGYCWRPHKRIHWGGEVQNHKKRGVCGLDHKRMQYLCDVCAQRDWSCSHYTVQPSWLVVPRSSNFQHIRY